MQSGHTDSANFEECEISFFALGYFAPPAGISYETRFKGAPSGASGRLTHFRRCTSMTDEAFSRAARTYYAALLFRAACHVLWNRLGARDVMQTVPAL